MPRMVRKFAESEDDYGSDRPPGLNETTVLTVPKLFVMVLRKTKIVGTLGPASAHRIEELIHAGVNTFRVNFSHASEGYVKEKEMIDNIKAAREKLDIPVGILCDLCGPKVRCGKFEENPGLGGVRGIQLVEGEDVTLRASESGEGKPGLILTPIFAVVADLEEGHHVLLEDGKMKIRVEKRVSKDEVLCKVVVGGVLKEKKGINVPDLALGLSALTEKDKNDCKFIVTQGVEYVALSFVQRAADVKELREYMMANAGSNVKFKHLPKIVSKIEKPQAVDAIDSIIDETDAIMVARGDLGVECNVETVPPIQKLLIQKCNAKNKPVITATQMLESMIEAPVPTRAEVSDVANAVYDGTDAVMLSGECAAGSYPIEAVTTMGTVCVNVEKCPEFALPGTAHEKDLSLQEMFHDSLAKSAVVAANRCKAQAIIVVTLSGNMAVRVSKYKPNVPIIVLALKPYVYQRMALLSNVTPAYLQDGIKMGSEDLFYHAECLIEKKGLVDNGAPVVWTSGNHSWSSGLRNVLRLEEFGAAQRSHEAQKHWSSALHRVNSKNSNA